MCWMNLFAVISGSTYAWMQRDSAQYVGGIFNNAANH